MDFKIGCYCGNKNKKNEKHGAPTLYKRNAG
jgi:hypothetical protein